MSGKMMLYHDAARAALAAGAKLLADAVRVTLGPKGRNVVLEKQFGSPLITNDGVTIAKEISIGNPFHNMGVELLKEVASTTGDAAGDGTTTATVLAHSMLQEGLRNVAAGANPLAIKRGMDAAVSAAVRTIKQRAVPVQTKEGITEVAALAAGGDLPIGRIIAEAMELVGKDGVITIEDSQTLDTTIGHAEGMEFGGGFISPYMVTDQARLESVLTDPLILITNHRIANLADIVHILEEVAETGRPLVIIAQEVEGEALATLLMNHMHGILACTAVRAPGYGGGRMEMLKDIAVLTGGQLIAGEVGIAMDRVTLDMLGQARHVKVTKETTLIVDGKGTLSTIKARVAGIKADIRAGGGAESKEQMQERLAKLVGGVAVINVGAATETEIREKRLRIEDALAATRAAVEEGIVPGGGATYLAALPAIDALALNGEEGIGVNIVRRALEAPLRQIAANAGLEGAIVVERVKTLPPGQGLNALTGEYVDLIKAGIADPAKVARLALQHAASIAALMLTTEVLITDAPEVDDHVHVPRDDIAMSDMGLM